jgi:hypothetical protein
VGHYGSYLLQVHPIGLGTTLYYTHSAIFEYCTGLPRQADREEAVIQERGRRREERNEIKKEDFAVYDRVCHNQL